jgi:hypothetical protein
MVRAAFESDLHAPASVSLETLVQSRGAVCAVEAAGRLELAPAVTCLPASGRPA